jgi:hypothetical protein
LVRSTPWRAPVKDHKRIALNIATASLATARRGSCWVVGSDQRLPAGESLYSHADIQVLCDTTDDDPHQAPPVSDR